MFFCLTTSLYSGDIFNHSVSFRFWFLCFLVYKHPLQTSQLSIFGIEDQYFEPNLNISISVSVFSIFLNISFFAAIIHNIYLNTCTWSKSSFVLQLFNYLWSVETVHSQIARSEDQWRWVINTCDDEPGPSAPPKTKIAYRSKFNRSNKIELDSYSWSLIASIRRHVIMSITVVTIHLLGNQQKKCWKRQATRAYNEHK